MPNWKKVVVSGSAANLSSLHVDTSVTASIFSGSEFIGNLSGTASQAISSSYALTASYISGSSDSAISASYALSSSYALTASYIAVLPTIVTGSNATFVQPTPANTWTFVHNLNDQYPVFQVFNASNEVIIPTSITANNTTTATITFSVPTAGTAVASIGGFTGSATALSASYAATASFAFTASYALNVPETASYAISASHADDSDNAISSSYALTASYALNVPETASYAISASHAFYAVTTSYALDAELLDGLDSTSFTTTSSFNSFTSSVVTNYATKVELNTSASALQAGVTSSISVAISDLQAGVTASIAGFATTGSNTFTGTNNFNVVSASYIQALSASIDYLSVIYQTSSIVYSSGSNIFGDNANDTQTLWGTVNIVTGPLNVTGSTTLQYLTASGLHYPTVDGTVEQFLSTDGAGNLSFADVRTLYQNIRNREAVTLPKGTPLFVSGSTGDNADVFIADSSNPARMPATLIAGDATLAPGAVGRGIILGHIEGVNTSGYPAGTEVYVGAGGGWTSTRPTGSSVVQSLGIVTRESNNGMGIVLTVPPATLPNIAQGYTWVGDLNGVPQAVATSSINNVVSASYAVSASRTVSAANADTASYVALAQTASYVTTAQTASYVTTAQTASYVLNAVSSSTAVSSSFALTASYALNAEGSGATTGSNTFIGDQVISGSLAVTGSVAGNVILTPTTASNVLVTAGFNGMLISPVQLQGSSSVAIGSNLIIL